MNPFDEMMYWKARALEAEKAMEKVVIMCKKADMDGVKLEPVVVGNVLLDVLIKSASEDLIIQMKEAGVKLDHGLVDEIINGKDPGEAALKAMQKIMEAYRSKNSPIATP